MTMPAVKSRVDAFTGSTPAVAPPCTVTEGR